MPDTYFHETSDGTREIIPDPTIDGATIEEFEFCHEEDQTLPPRLDSFYKRVNYCRPPGMTDKAFAKFLGVHPSTFYKWKHKGSMPQIGPQINPIAAALEVPYWWLWWGYRTRVITYPDGRQEIAIPSRARLNV